MYRNKLFLLETYNAVHKYDILCITEAYLDFSVPFDATTLPLTGYNLVRSDHPNNIKRGGACLYHKENLSLRSINAPFFFQCVLCEVTSQSQKGYVIVIYQSQSLLTVEFDEFLSSLLLKDLNHPLLLYSSISMQDLNHDGQMI